MYTESQPWQGSPLVINWEVIDRLKTLGKMDSTFFARIVSLFCCTADRTIEEIEESVRKNDRKALKHTAHRLRGSAANVGAKLLSERCAFVEQNAENFNQDEIDQSVALIRQELEVVKNAFETMTE